jgi:hypothetical protein
MGIMAANDLHLRRVYFHFGAGSGGTSVLAVYPAAGVVIAILANLGHARFPFRPLVSIVEPFLPRPGPDVAVVVASVACLGLSFLAVRRRRREGTRASALARQGGRGEP